MATKIDATAVSAPTRKIPRRGFAMAAVLICLLVVMMMGSALLQAVMLQQRQIRTSQQSLQSFWLAESGMQRALHQLDQSADYQGETWNVPAALLGADARVVIRIEPVTEPGTGNQIHVAATYPNVEKLRTLSQRERFVRSEDKEE